MNRLLSLTARTVIGHRGAAAEAPENTLTGFDLALAQGAEAFELDVHATADGVPVVIHDPTLERVTDRSGRVADLDWSVVGRARIGGTEPIARLEDVLDAWPDIRLNIDVKDAAAVAPTANAIERTYMLADMLPPGRAEQTKDLLRRYVDLRLGIRTAEEMQTAVVASAS